MVIEQDNSPLSDKYAKIQHLLGWWVQHCHISKQCCAIDCTDIFYSLSKSVRKEERQINQCNSAKCNLTWHQPLFYGPPFWSSMAVAILIFWSQNWLHLDDSVVQLQLQIVESVNMQCSDRIMIHIWLTLPNLTIWVCEPGMFHWIDSLRLN